MLLQSLLTWTVTGRTTINPTVNNFNIKIHVLTCIWNHIIGSYVPTPYIRICYTLYVDFCECPREPYSWVVQQFLVSPISQRIFGFLTLNTLLISTGLFMVKYSILNFTTVFDFVVSVQLIPYMSLIVFIIGYYRVVYEISRFEISIK